MGPRNLCADRESRSILSVSTFTGSEPIACTASEWNGMPLSWQILPISVMGWIMPVSLFAYMTDTRTVSGRIADATASGLTRPSGSTGKRVFSKPSASRALTQLRTAGCSIAVVIICFLPCVARCRATPAIARLSDSVPDDVKIISFGDAAPRAAATCLLAVSIAVRARRPGSCIDDGLPYDSSR